MHTSFDYENTSKTTEVVNGKSIEVCTPFVAVSGLMLNADKFSNVTATNAKVISDGDRIIVAGAAMPGLRDSLAIDGNDISDLDIPEYIEIACETTDFQLDGTLSYVSADFLDDVDEDDLNTDSIGAQLSEMQDGMAQLVDGGNPLKAGLGPFNEEAVQKIVDLYNGDITNLVDRTKALVRAGKAYDNFSGKADGTTGKVKFIYESAGTTSEE